MLLYITEDTFAGADAPAAVRALRMALSSRQLGFSRLVVAPRATEAATEAGYPQDVVEALQLVQRGWLEGQSLLATLSRVIALVGDRSRHGKLVGNKYEVYVGDVASDFVFKEPALVTENMAVDARLLTIYLRWLWQKAPDELGKTWGVRPEMGGGDTIRTFVRRFAARPEPTLIICDRDSAGLPAYGDTARNCIGEIVRHGLFISREAAIGGGFSEAAAAFAFELHGCWSIENLVFPEMAEIYFTHVKPDQSSQDRRTALAAAFPGFPAVPEPDAARWLGTNMKKLPEYGGKPVLTSNCLTRLLDWAEERAENEAMLRNAFSRSIAAPAFAQSILKIAPSLIALGVRDRSLI